MNQRSLRRKEKYMATIEELRAQQAEIESQIKSMEKAERDKAVKTIREMCRHYEVRLPEIQSSLAESRRGRKPKMKVDQPVSGPQVRPFR